MCKHDPSLLHTKQFDFYREYLESLGAKIPPATSSSAHEDTSEKEENNGKEEQRQEDEEVPLPELDNSGVQTDKTGDLQLSMGDLSKQVAEEEIERANESRESAMAAFSEGNYQSSFDLLTKAIELNPGSAILHAKRANTLLKMSMMKAAIQDCDKAIAINPDSAQPYKFRGRANQLLGNWTEAHHDFATSCKLDYDDVAYGWMKEVEPNAKKLQEYERAKQRRAEEKEQRERLERVRRAQEANRKAKESAADSGESGAPFGMGPFTEMFKELSDDPELLSAIKSDPSLIQKLMEIMQNPANMMKHMNDPNVQKVLEKLGSKLGPASSFANETGRDSTPFGAATEGTQQQKGTADKGPEAPKKAPEPELD
ncbi:hypothetical protein niasHT_022594 [Heterodera trifolii]|uniref:STI1 domain-containing protein n=1 Tax=Heterodera trifolii TaxID=157864 RepID=A0ABD2JRN9_9BILA